MLHHTFQDIFASHGVACAEAESDRAWDRLIDRQDQAQAMLEERAKDYMEPGEECDPMNPRNLEEAIVEAKPEFFAAMVKLLQSNNHEGLALAIKTVSKDYWQSQAEGLAERRA